MRARSIPSRLSTLFGKRNGRLVRSAAASRRGRHAITSTEQLESRQMLAFQYQGFTHTAVPTLPRTQAYQYNFEIFQSDPSDSAAMFMRNVNNTATLEFAYDTAFNSLNNLGTGLLTNNGLALPAPAAPGVVGPARLVNAFSFPASFNTPSPTTETFVLAKVRVVARPGTVDPMFVLHVGDSMPLALEVDFSQAVGTSTIIIRSELRDTIADDTGNPPAVDSLPNGGGGYDFLASRIFIQAQVTPQLANNNYRATDLIRIENAVAGGLNARVASGNFEIVAGASVGGAVNVTVGGGVPPTANSSFAAYGFGGNGGDIIIDGQINSGSSVVLESYSVDPRVIRTGPTGFIEGSTSILLNNAGAGGGVINVETRNFAQHNIFAGSASNQAADIGIEIRQTAGNLTLNALPASVGKIDLRAPAGAVVVNANIDTIGALALSAATLNVTRPLSTERGDITLSGNSVTLGSNLTAGRTGIGNLVVNAAAGGVNVTSSAVVQAPEDSITISATTTITSQATLSADNAILNAGGAINVKTAVASLTAVAGGALTINEADGIVVDRIATTAAGAVSVTAGGLLDLVDVATAGTGDVVATTTAGGLLARDIRTQDGNIALTASSGDIEAVGDVFVNGTGRDFTLSATTGNIIMSPVSTFTVADQLAFNAPLGRVLTPGTISSVSVTNSGTGYGSVPSVSFASGSGATVSLDVGSRQVTFVRVTQGGSGYVSAPAVVFGNAGTGGAGAAASAVMQNGVVIGVNITSGGANYISAPTISFVGGGGSGALAEASIDGLTAINTTAPGSGYQVPPTVVISSGDGGTTAAVKVDSLGSITGINLSQPGGSYNAAPTVVITDTSGSGFGATATAAISGGVSGGIVTAGGSGYAATTTATVSGGGSGATGLPLLGLTSASLGSPTAGTNYRSGDLLTVLAGSGARVAVSSIGPVSAINIGSPGSGYTAATVNINPPAAGGVQATATATVAGGVVTAITITNPGSGYTTAPTVTISGDGTGATATAVVVPSAVATLQLLDGGRDYSVGDILYLNDLPLGASGLRATVSAVSTSGTITGLAVTAGGTGYTTAMRIGHIGGTGGVLQVNFGLAAIGTTITPSNGGTGYTTAPTVTIAGGGGTGATATATVAGGVVTLVTITNPGTGYTTRPVILFSGGAGSNAAATAPLPPSALTSPLATLSVFRPGSGYTNRPTRVVGGSGSGGAITFNDTNYSVVGYRVVQPGSAYSSSSPPTITLGNVGTGAGAVIAPSISGVVTGIAVTNAGTGYDPATTQIAITPVAAGSGASGRAISVNGLGAITAVNVATPGAGYVAAPRVTIVDRSGTGFGAQATASISGGVTAFSLTNAGSGYTSAPMVSFTGGGGMGATAIATVSGGFVTGITITNPGSGYTSAPMIGFSGGAGSGAAATATISNVVTGITMTSTGVGYNPDTTDVTLDPIGSGATAVANLTNGQVTSIKITDNGSGYSAATAPVVTLVPYGSGALATASLSGGGVGSVTVTVPGANYAVPPVVLFSGGGFTTPATATATVGSVAQLSAGRLTWTALEQPLDALLDQFAIASITLTGAGDLDVTRASGDLVLEGAQTKDGSIRIAAQSLTVTGPVVAGDFNTSRSETVTLDALGGDLTIQAAVTAPLTVTLEADSGAITGTTAGIVTTQNLVISALTGVTLRTAVDTVRGGVSGDAAPLTITESDAISLGTGTASGQTLFANNGAISVSNLDGNLSVQQVNAGATGSVTLAAAINLVEAAVSTTTAEIIAASATLSSASGRVDVDTNVQTLSASAPLSTVTIDNLGLTALTVTSVTARNNVAVAAASAMQVVTATSTLNNVVLTTTNSGSTLTVGAISAPIGVVTLDSSADVTQGTLTGQVTATGARVLAAGTATLRTTVGTLGATAAGAVTITETDAITLGETGGGVPANFARVQSTTGSVSVTAAGLISALVVNAPQGGITLTSSGNAISVGAVTAGTASGVVTLSANQSITDNDTLVDITGFRAVLTSTTGSIGAASDPLELAVTEVSATATAGLVDLSEADGLVITGVAATGASITAGGAISQTGAIVAPTLSVIATAAGTVTLGNVANNATTLTGSTTSGTFTYVDADAFTVGTAGITAGAAGAGNGDIFLTATTGNLGIAGSLTALDDRISLAAPAGTITQTAGTITANVLEWTALSAPTFTSVVFNVIGANLTGPGNLSLGTAGQAITVASASTANGNVSVVGSNVVIDGLVSVGGVGKAGSITASGSLLFQNTGRVVNADATGTVALTAGTTLSATNLGSQTTVSAGGSLSVNAGGPTSLKLDVASLAATVSAGGLTITDVGALAIAGITAAGQAVSLTASTGITQTGVIVASALSASTTSGGVILQAANDAATVSGFTSSGDFRFTDANGFTAGSVTAGAAGAGDGSIELTASTGNLVLAGNLTALDDRVTLRAPAGTITQNAGSVITADELVWQAQSASFQSNNQVDSLGINVTSVGSVRVPQAGTFSGTLRIAEVTTVAGNIEIVADDVRISGLVQAGGAGSTVIITAATGGIAFVQNGRVVVADPAGGNVTLSAATAISTTTAASVVNVTTPAALAATASSGGVVLTTDVLGVTASASSDITLTDIADIALAGVSAGTVTISAGGSITSGVAGVDLTAIGVNLTAGGGIALDLAAGTVSASAAGTITLTDIDAVTLASVGSTSGSVAVTAGGALAATTVSAATGNVSLVTTAGGIAVGAVTANTTSGVATITSAGAITNDDTAVDVTAATAALAAATGSITLDLAVGAVTASAPGSITLADTDGLTLTSVASSGGSVVVSTAAGNIAVASVAANAATGTVTLTAAASITDLDADTDITAATALLTAGTGGISADLAVGVVTATAPGSIDLSDVDAVTLTSVVSTAGNVAVTAGGLMTATLVSAAAGSAALVTTAGNVAVGSVTAGTATLTAAASITDGDAAVDLTAASATLNAGTGSIDLDLAVSTVGGTAAGAILLSNTGAVTLSNLRSTAGDVTVFAATGGIAIAGVTVNTATGVVLLQAPSGSITQPGGPITAAVVEIVAPAAASIDLSNAGNLVGTLETSIGSAVLSMANAGALSIVADAGLSIARVVAQGNLAVATPGNLVIGPPTSPFPVLQSTTQIDLREVDGTVTLINGGRLVAPTVLVNPSNPVIDVGGSVQTTAALNQAVAAINALDPIAGAVYQITVGANLTLTQTLVFNRGVALTGPGFTLSGSAAVTTGVTVNAAASGSRITNIAFAGFSDTAVRLSSATGVAISGISVSGSGNGLWISGTSTNTTVQGSRFTDNNVAIRLGENRTIGATGLVIGGTAAAQRNTIAGARRAGVVATGFCTGSRIIGTTFTASPRTRVPFDVRSSRGLRISGTTVQRAPAPQVPVRSVRPGR